MKQIIMLLTMCLYGTFISFVTPIATAQPSLLDPELGTDGGLTAGLWSEDIILGSADAPLVVVEYLSWTCPYCQRFHELAVKPIILPLVDEGLVRFISRDLLRNWIDLRVAMAVRCEGNDFKDASDKLFAAQQSYLVNDPETVDAAIAAALDMSAAELEACYADTEKTQWLVERTQEAVALEIQSTPSVFINGKRFELSNTAQLEDVLRRQAAAVFQ